MQKNNKKTSDNSRKKTTTTNKFSGANDIYFTPKNIREAQSVIITIRLGR